MHISNLLSYIKMLYVVEYSILNFYMNASFLLHSFVILLFE